MDHRDEIDTKCSMFLPDYEQENGTQKNLGEESRTVHCRSLNSEYGNSRNMQYFDKVQLTKLLVHTLREMGYQESAISLQKESGGIQVESSVIQTLFILLRKGQYTDIDFETLAQLPIVSSSPSDGNRVVWNLYQTCLEYVTDEDPIEMNVKGIAAHMSVQHKIFVKCVDCITLKYEGLDVLAGLDHLKSLIEVFLLINRQIFTEMLLIHHDYAAAVDYLRRTLRPILETWERIIDLAANGKIHDTKEDSEADFSPKAILLELSSLLIKPNLKDIANSEESELSSRENLIDDISAYINPNDLVPKGRLFTLLKQAMAFQKSQDILALDDDGSANNADSEGARAQVPTKAKFNLLQDNRTSIRDIEFCHERTLSENSDEIWYLEFSPDGKYLASATADSKTKEKILVYDVQNDFQLYKILTGNDQCVLYLSFSPDSRFLVSCPFNDITNIYDIHASGTPARASGLSSDIIPEIIEPISSFKMESTNDNSGNRTQESQQDNNLNFGVITSGGTSNTSPETASSASSSGVVTPTTTVSYPRVWCCDWFHSPKMRGKLAVGSPDRDVAIYDINKKRIIYTLAGHTVEDRSKVTSHHYPLTNFSPIAQTNLNQETTTEQRTNSFVSKLFPRVHDIKITLDDKYLILMCPQGCIEVYDLTPFNDIDHEDELALRNLSLRLVSRLNIEKTMTCITLPHITGPNSPLATLLLASVRDNEIQLWDFKENILLQRYYGQKQEHFIIRSCFGYNNKLIASGSEDGKVYIWNRNKGNIIAVLSAHSNARSTSINCAKKCGKNCNVVVWSPTEKDLLASAGDDGYIKIWRLKR